MQQSDCWNTQPTSTVGGGRAAGRAGLGQRVPLSRDPTKGPGREKCGAFWPGHQRLRGQQGWTQGRATGQENEQTTEAQKSYSVQCSLG